MRTNLRDAGAGMTRAGVSGRELVSFTASLSALTALGIDTVLPALGDIRAEYGLPPASTSAAWVITAYFLGLATGQFWYGPLADRYGRKRTMHLGLVLFSAGALGAAFAPSFPALVAIRYLWGVGAAGPRVVSLTIIRDVFDGDRMARVMLIATTVFLLAPVVAPSLGEVLLAIGGVPLTFGFGAALAAVMALWSTRIAETLREEHRRPLTIGRSAAALRTVVSNPVTRGYTLLVTFEMGAFVAYLGSSELLIGDVFGRGDHFALIFGGVAVVMGAGALANARMIGRVGATTILRRAVVGYLAGGCLLLGVSVAAGGVPNFAVWIALVALLNSGHAVIVPTANTLAMEPMGAQAGIASAVIGTVTMGGGSLLAAVVDRTIDGSATPLAVAYVGYGVLAAGGLLLAQRGTVSLAGADRGSLVGHGDP